MSIFKKRTKKNHYSTLLPNKRTSVKDNEKKKDIPQGLWMKCTRCGETIYNKEKKKAINLCPLCNYHYPMTAWERIELLTDENSFSERDSKIKPVDTLKFESYSEKIESSIKKTGLNDAIVCGSATLENQKYAIGVMDFRFMGASMGSVVGEKVTRITEYATKNRLPLVIVTASGGARMQEGMLSLMQMAITSGALQRHKAAGLPYIVIMTHPTFAGVTASFASLGDLTLAEPDAMIGFAGPRVIKDTTQSELPEGFQTAEFLLEKGMIDKIIARTDLRNELSLCLDYFSGGLK